MISNLSIAGLMVVSIVCIALPVLSLLFCIRQKRCGNPVYIILMGFAVSMLLSSFAGAVTSLKPIADIGESSYLLYVVILSVLIGIFEAVGRYFLIGYVKKTGGIGFYRGLALGTGFGGSMLLLQGFSYFSMISQAKMINAGTFVDTIMKQGNPNVTEAQVLEVQNAFAAIPPAEFFVQALDRGAMFLLQIAIVLIMVKLLQDNKKGLAIGTAAAIRGVYELVTRTVYFSSSDYLGRILSTTAALSILAVIVAAGAVASVLCIMKIKPLIPEEKPGMTVPRVRTAPPEEEKKSTQWQIVRQLEQDSIKKESGMKEKEEDQK